MLEHNKRWIVVFRTVVKLPFFTNKVQHPNKSPVTMDFFSFCNYIVLEYKGKLVQCTYIRLKESSAMMFPGIPAAPQTLICPDKRNTPEQALRG